MTILMMLIILMMLMLMIYNNNKKMRAMMMTMPMLLQITMIIMIIITIINLIMMMIIIIIIIIIMVIRGFFLDLLQPLTALQTFPIQTAGLAMVVSTNHCLAHLGHMMMTPRDISANPFNRLLLLLLLCSQLYLWDSPFGVRFFHMCPFFNPTIEVVTFSLRGWCMLGVFLLPAFIRLGHECQDLLSSCDGNWYVCVHRLDLGIYSHLKSFGGMESETILTRREKYTLPEAQKRFEPAMLHHAGQ